MVMVGVLWMTYLGTSMVGLVVVWIVLWVLVSLVLPTLRVSQVILGGWRVSWGSDGVGVVGVGAGRGLRMGGWRFRACHPWREARCALVVGWWSVGLQSWWCRLSLVLR